MIVVNASTRQFTVPGADLVFGVEADSGSERKVFQCPRYVGNNLDITGCFVRINYRNANGEIDSYLVDDLAVDGDNVVFSWTLTQKVTMYKGQVKFVMCVVGPDLKVKWHTTHGTGQVLEGLEPDGIDVEAGTADVVAQLIAMVEQQTEAVKSEGAAQIKAVQTAAETAEAVSVAEIEAKGVNTRNSIPADYTALSKAVDSLTRGRAGAIVCEAAGESVVVSDSSDLPMQGLRIFGRSTQDGTPTPEAPVEIVSVEKPVVTVAGKNLLSVDVESKTVMGITYTVNEDRSITADGTATDNAYLIFNNSVFLKAGTEYTLTGCPAGGSVNEGYHVYIESASIRDTGNGVTFTPKADLKTRVVIAVRPGTTISNITFYPMLRYSWQDDVYEPYNGGTIETTHTLPGIPVTSGGNYTDENGQQWVCDEVDLERGVYVQRVELKTFTLYKSPYEFTSLGYRYQHHAGNNFTPVNVCLCKTLPYNPNVGTDLETTDGVRLNNSAGYIIAQYTDADGTADSIDLDILYILPTPIETPLSETELAAYRALHSNYPNTTILNDGGAHMVVKYAADTKLYIDNKIKEALQ